MANEHSSGSHYRMLILNLVASLAVMYLVMFSMIAGMRDFYNNLNMLYMALTMVAPMGMLMLLMMRSMYPNKRLNLALHAGLAFVFVAALFATRAQAGIGNEHFLRSMIPHHSGAILMCREAPVTDPELLALCSRIIESQQAEIDQMRRMLGRM